MAGRLIDADTFLEEARSRIDMQDMYLPVHIKEFVIDEMPTVDPVRKSKWAFGRICKGCGEVAYTYYNYCPNCGAKMCYPGAECGKCDCSNCTEKYREVEMEW